MIRVMIADDHDILRRGLRGLVDAHPHMRVVGEARSDQEALAVLDRTQVDVLVLDLSLPEAGGLALFERLRQEYPAVRVCFFTMYPEDQLALHLLNKGASAYLCKTRPPEELIEAISLAARGRSYLSVDLRRLKQDAEVERRLEGAPHGDLTARELQVFYLLIEGRTVTEVANELDLSKSTVSNHVARIKEKLGAASLGEIIRYAARVGLLAP